MEYSKPKGNPEALGAARLIKFMRAKGWSCWKVGAGKYVSGWPDYYCHHPIFCHRWIETKTLKGKLSSSQIKRFGELKKSGDKVFVLTDETHYPRLFKQPNWEQFIRGV